jgi:N-acyl-phosphatidylethanolamine-hydrolysing phospholipase D
MGRRETAVSPPPDVPAEARVYYAGHRRGGAFYNPWRPFPHRPWTVLRWWLSRNPYRRAAAARPPQPAPVPGMPRAGGPALTWVGHATFAVEAAGTMLLTDPHFGPRALVPRRLTPPGLPLEAVPAGALAVVSHNHYDHLDRWTVRRLPADVTWHVPLGLGPWFRREGVERVVELDWWQSARHGTWTLTCLPAQHWSNRISQKRDASLWCSWLLDCGERRVYFAGDSGWFGGFAEIGRRFPGIDVALLPIGAYEPRWFMAYQHLDPGEAYRAFRALGARSMVGMHWGCFDLTDEPVDLAPRVLAGVVAAAGGDPRVRMLAVGETWPLAGAAATMGP